MSGRQSDERTPIVAPGLLPVARVVTSGEGVQPVSATLSVTLSRFDGWTLLAIAGAIDGVTAPELHVLLREFTDQSVTVDLNDVTFIDASGLRTLMRAHEEIILAGGRMAIRGPRPSVHEVCDTTGLTDWRAGDPLTT